MAVDERRRKDLYDALEQRIGAEEATTLMELLPPTGWADVATKRDLTSLREVLEARIEAADARIISAVSKMESKMTRLIAFANVGSIFTVAALAFGAARLT